jgi:sigma-B regulation protein RsbU (phosphoserine phosphatase)
MTTIDIQQNHRVCRVSRLKRELAQCRSLEGTIDTLLDAFADIESSVASLLLSTAGYPPGHYRVLRAVLPGEPPIARHGAEAGVLRGGTIAAITAVPQPRVLEAVDWSNDLNFHQILGDYTSVIAIPLEIGHLPMNWALLLKRAPESFSERELEDAVERSTLICALLRNQSLAEELTKAHEKIDLDARQMGDLQRALLPASLPRIAGLEIAASYEPCGRAGGDLYDFFPLEQPPEPGGDRYPRSTTFPSPWCVLIGDASGHGLAAAVVMAIVQAVLRAHPEHVDGPASLLMHANRQLHDKNLGGFFTAFLGIYDPCSRRLTYANAGHPPPLLRHAADGSVTALDSVLSYPLGIDATETFHQATIELMEDDSLLLYTDGITDVRNAAGEFLTQERLMQLQAEGRNTPAELIHHLREVLNAHQQGRAAPDDQTLVVVRVL